MELDLGPIDVRLSAACPGLCGAPQFGDGLTPFEKTALAQSDLGAATDANQGRALVCT